MRAASLAAFALLLALPAAAAPPEKPSRPAQKGCAWEKVEGAGLSAFVERCSFGDRKIDLFIEGSSLFQRWSDGGPPEPLIDVYDLREGETPEAGLRRIFAERTEKKIAARCVLAPWREGKVRRGVRRFTFVPDAAYAKEIEKTSSPDEVGDPPCGDFGAAPDGIQYFEAQQGARKVLFVRVGQDEPLFDENTLTIRR